MIKTKIIATLGPSTRSIENLERLIEAGCNIIRINMSHSSREEADAIMEDVRTLSDEVAILVDTKGPEVRTTIAPTPVKLSVGDEILIEGNPDGETITGHICVTYSELPKVVEVGTLILIADGQMEVQVTTKSDKGLHCEVIRGGTLTSKKGINIPGVKLPMPFLSEQDREDITFAARSGADFVAASFVGDVNDVDQVKALIEKEGGHARVISKIESQYAIANLNAIIEASDGIMVARGDLGVEIPAERVPVAQKQMIKACRKAGRSVIVATEMLESMIHNPRPTRAETSDVANAIFEGADAVMLSAETSVGKYPFDAVKMMVRIAEIAEHEFAQSQSKAPDVLESDISELICKSAWLAAQDLKLNAILIPTSSGRTAKRMSRFRPSSPILATTPDMVTARSLALCYGVYALPARHFGRMETMVRRSCQVMIDAGYLSDEGLIAVAAGVPVGRSGSTNLLSIQSLSAVMGRGETDD
jgi:pyruvate kinase